MAQKFVSVNQALIRSGMVDKIKTTLADPQRLSALQAKGRKLAALFETLSNATKVLGDQAITSSHANALSKLGTTANRINTSLSAQLSMNKARMNKSATNQIIATTLKKIFILEHEILDEMTNQATATTDYDIYYTSTRHSTEVMRGRIKAKDLYNSKHVGVDGAGNIVLKASVLQQFRENPNSNTQRVDTDAAYQELAAIIAAYVGSLSSQYQMLLRDARARHIGGHQDNIHDALRSLLVESDVGQEITTYAQQVYARYINQQGEAGLFGLINRGHLAEAYSNYLNLDQESRSSANYLELLKQSLGNDPWYIGGDVGSIQVKSFLDNASQRQIASLNSIISLGRKLLNILNNHVKELSNITRSDAVIQKMKAQGLAKGEDIVNTAIENEILTLADIILGR